MDVTESRGSLLTDSIEIGIDDLKTNTYSPMLKKYGHKPMRLSIEELLEWSLVESDNNAADILINYVGGIDSLTSAFKRLNIPDDITIGATEDDMHRDPYLCYLNRSTPVAMAQLFDHVYNIRYNEYAPVTSMLEKCRTGHDRLSEPLKDTGATVAHKTGTGDIMENGRLSALNDCGFIRLSDGTDYTIVVFIADSAYDIEETSKIMAHISEIVYLSLIK